MHLALARFPTLLACLGCLALLFIVIENEGGILLRIGWLPRVMGLPKLFQEVTI